MAEQQPHDQNATGSEGPGLWKAGNSPIPNNPANFLETECEQNQLDSPFFSANSVFATPLAGNDPRTAETPQQNHTNTHTYTIHPTNQSEITTQVSSTFQAHQGAQADEGRKTETYPHTHTPTHTHTLQKRLSSGSVRAQTLQVLAQLGVAEASESQIQAVKTAVTSASANDAMPASLMQMGDYPGRIHASQQNPLRQKTAINEPAEDRKSHAMQIVANFPCAQDALSCTSLQMGDMTASAQQPALSRRNAYLFPHDGVGSLPRGNPGETGPCRRAIDITMSMLLVVTCLLDLSSALPSIVTNHHKMSQYSSARQLIGASTFCAQSSLHTNVGALARRSNQSLAWSSSSDLKSSFLFTAVSAARPSCLPDTECPVLANCGLDS